MGASRRKSRALTDLELAAAVGRRIRALREEREISRRALAQRAEVALTSLNLLETGRTQPSLKTLHALARALGVRVADFFKEEPPATAPPGSESKTFVKITERLRARDEDYLRAVDRLIRSFDAAVESVTE